MAFGVALTRRSRSWTASGRDRAPLLARNRAFAAGVLIEAPLIVVAFFVWLIGIRRGWQMQDFAAMRAGAQAVLHGHSPYPPLDPRAIALARHLVYPPLVAYLFVPFALLPYKIAAATYFLLSIGAIPAALFVLRVSDWRCYGVALLWYPMIGCLNTGALGPLLALLLALAWRYRDARAAGPALLAVSVTMKLFLWPLAVWLLATRRWRAALVTCLLTAATFLAPFAPLGSGTLRTYPRILRMLDDLFGPVSFSSGTFFRAAGAPREMAQVLVVLVALGLAVLMFRSGNDRGSFVLAIAAALLLSPIVWMHYYVLLVVPIALTRPRLSGLWFVPLLYWASPYLESSGKLSRLLVGVGVTSTIVLVSGLATRQRGVNATASPTPVAG